MTEYKNNATFLIFTMFLRSPRWFGFIERLGIDIIGKNDITNSTIGRWYLQNIHQIVYKRRHLNGK